MYFHSSEHFLVLCVFCTFVALYWHDIPLQLQHRSMVYTLIQSMVKISNKYVHIKLLN